MYGRNGFGGRGSIQECSRGLKSQKSGGISKVEGGPPRGRGQGGQRIKDDTRKKSVRRGTQMPYQRIHGGKAGGGWGGKRESYHGGNRLLLGTFTRAPLRVEETFRKNPIGPRGGRSGKGGKCPIGGYYQESPRIENLHGVCVGGGGGGGVLGGGKNGQLIGLGRRGGGSVDLHPPASSWVDPGERNGGKDRQKNFREGLGRMKKKQMKRVGKRPFWFLAAGANTVMGGGELVGSNKVEKGKNEREKTKIRKKT